MNHQAELNDLIREAFSAQTAFDNWDEGKTWPDRTNPWSSEPRLCSLDEVVHELDSANLRLVRFVLDHPQLVAELRSPETVRAGLKTTEVKD